MEILSPEAYRTVLEALPTGVYLVDRERRILLWSKGAEELTGYLQQEVLGRSCRDDLLMHCDEANTILCGVACPLQQTMHDGHCRSVDMFLLHKDGRRTPVTVCAVPLRNDRGSIVGAVECFERRTVLPTADPSLRQLSQSATLDPATGLPDRSSTEARLRAYLQAYEVSPVPFGVLTVEVDQLESLRRADGRTAIDAVLGATGRTIAASLGPNDMAGHWPPDRFVAVISGCAEPTLIRVANRLKRLVEMEAVPWWGGRLKVTLSVGSTVVQPGDTPQTLMERADESLKRAKNTRENSSVLELGRGASE